MTTKTQRTGSHPAAKFLGRLTFYLLGTALFSAIFLPLGVLFGVLGLFWVFNP